MVQSTNNSGDLNHEYIERYLDVGTYHVCVASNDTYMLDVYCYLIIERFDTGEDTSVVMNGELYGNYVTYADTMFDFYKKADYSYNYNCAGYAIGNLNYNGGVSYSIAKAKEFLSDYTYHAGAPTNVSNCIVAYGWPNNILHYARIDNGVVSCKFGNMEELYHTGYNAYLPNDNYGTAQAYFTK